MLNLETLQYLLELYNQTYLQNILNYKFCIIKLMSSSGKVTEKIAGFKKKLLASICPMYVMVSDINKVKKTIMISKGCLSIKVF